MIKNRFSNVNRRRQIIGLFSGLALLLWLPACAGSEPSPAVQEEPDHGAGIVVRIDPRLDEIVPTEYKIERLAGDMIFTEGPVWIEDGSYLLFSDIRANTIYRWSPKDGLSKFLFPLFEGSRTGGIGSNGLTLDSDGNLIICEHGNRRVSRLRFKEGAEREVIVDRYQGKKLNSPNDLVYRSDGSLYFTDPPYGLQGQDESPEKELEFSGIFRLSADESNLELLYTGLERPNGIGLSPDEKTLYVANSFSERKIWMAFDVNEDGSLENERVFFDVTLASAPGGTDGMKLDKQGRLYCTGPGGVWIFTSEGEHLGTIQPEEVPANVGWGDDGKSLYMTARTGLYRIVLKTEGLRP